MSNDPLANYASTRAPGGFPLATTRESTRIVADQNAALMANGAARLRILSGMTTAGAEPEQAPFKTLSPIELSAQRYPDVASVTADLLLPPDKLRALEDVLEGAAANVESQAGGAVNMAAMKSVKALGLSPEQTAAIQRRVAGFLHAAQRTRPSPFPRVPLLRRAARDMNPGATASQKGDHCMYHVASSFVECGALDALRQAALEFEFELEKGAGHKYIRRVPKPGGGYRYYYAESAAARGPTRGESVRVGDRVVKIGEVTSEGVEVDGEVMSHKDWLNKLAEHYGNLESDAIRRSILYARAVARVLPKGALDAESAHTALSGALSRSGMTAESSARAVDWIVERRNWSDTAKLALLGEMTVGDRARWVQANYRRVASNAEARNEGLRGTVSGSQVADAVKELAPKPERKDRPHAELLAEAMAGAFPGKSFDDVVRMIQKAQALEARAAEPPKFDGDATSVYLPGKDGRPERLPARYKLVEAADLIASHNPETFAPRKDYPAGLQERAYHRDKAEQAKVTRNAATLIPEYVANTNPDAVNGAPLVDDKGVVLGGNSRTMSMQLAYQTGNGDKLKGFLEQSAQQFGLDAKDVAAMKAPVLVRVVDTQGRDPKLLVRQMNEGMTQDMDPRVMQVAMGRKLDEDAIGSLAADMGTDQTLSEFLDSPKAESFISDLRRVGIIDARNQTRYMRNGKLNADGKQLVERVLVGKVVGDPDLLSDTNPSVVTALAQAVPYMVQAEGSGAGYSVRNDLREALAAHNDMQRRNQAPRTAKEAARAVNDYIRNTDMFGGGEGELAQGESPLVNNPRARALTQVLFEKTGPRQLASVFRAYAEQAHENPEGQFSLFGPAKTPMDVFSEAVEMAKSQRGASNPLDALRKAAESDFGLGDVALLMKSDSFQPPARVASAAARGLRLRAKVKAGTSVGVARARDLSNGKSVSINTVGRMRSYFARHGAQRPENEGTDADPTPWLVAWLMWGGDAGKAWADSVWRRERGDDVEKGLEKAKRNRVATGPRGGKIVGYKQGPNGNQIAIYERPSKGNDGGAGPEPDGDSVAAKDRAQMPQKLREKADRIAREANGDAEKLKEAADISKLADRVEDMLNGEPVTDLPMVEVNRDDRPKDDTDTDTAGDEGSDGGEKAPPRRTPTVDTEPLIKEGTIGDPVGEGDPAPDSKLQRDLEIVAEARAEMQRMFDRMQEVEHLITSEYVPLFNQIKADIRQAAEKIEAGRKAAQAVDDTPLAKVLNYLWDKVAAFIDFIRKMAVAGLKAAGGGIKKQAAKRSKRGAKPDANAPEKAPEKADDDATRKSFADYAAALEKSANGPLAPDVALALVDVILAAKRRGAMDEVVEHGLAITDYGDEFFGYDGDGDEDDAEWVESRPEGQRPTMAQLAQLAESMDDDGEGFADDFEVPEALIPFLAQFVKACGALEKGAGHKYIRRVPKAGGGYRYYYRVSGVTRDVGADLVEGAAFRLAHDGKEGHFHVTARTGDKVTLRHDETGREMEVDAKALGAMLQREHAAVVQAKRESIGREIEQAKKTGTAKQLERLKAEAARMGVAEVPAPTQSEPKTKPFPPAEVGATAAARSWGDDDFKREAAEALNMTTPGMSRDEWVAMVDDSLGSPNKAARDKRIGQIASMVEWDGDRVAPSEFLRQLQDASPGQVNKMLAANVISNSPEMYEIASSVVSKTLDSADKFAFGDRGDVVPYKEWRDMFGSKAEADAALRLFSDIGVVEKQKSSVKFTRPETYSIRDAFAWMLFDEMSKRKPEAMNSWVARSSKAAKVFAPSPVAIEALIEHAERKGLILRSYIAGEDRIIARQNTRKSTAPLDALRKAAEGPWTADGFPLHPGVSEIVLPGGLRVRVETPKGEMRRGVDADGKAWAVEMPAHYGEIAGTLGTDGDPVDVFVGDDLGAPYVYVIGLRDPATGLHDEDKVMFGFGSREGAMGCYRDAYNRRDLLLDVRRLTVPEFQTWAAGRGKAGERVSGGRELRRSLDRLAVLAGLPTPRESAPPSLASLASEVAWRAAPDRLRGRPGGQRVAPVFTEVVRKGERAAAPRVPAAAPAQSLARFLTGGRR